MAPDVSGGPGRKRRNVSGLATSRVVLILISTHRGQAVPMGAESSYPANLQNKLTKMKTSYAISALARVTLISLQKCCLVSPLRKPEDYITVQPKGKDRPLIPQPTLLSCLGQSVAAAKAGPALCAKGNHVWSLFLISDQMASGSIH